MNACVLFMCAVLAGCATAMAEPMPTTKAAVRQGSTIIIENPRCLRYEMTAPDHIECTQH